MYAVAKGYSMQAKIIITGILIALGIAYAVFDTKRMAPSQIISAPPDENKYMSAFASVDFKYVDLNGKEHQLSDHHQKVIILNFWASWCAPCIKEFPDLLKLAATYPDEIIFLAISVDQDKASIDKFFKRYKIDISPNNVIIGHDPLKNISQDIFQTTMYPETFILDQGHAIQEKIVGITQWNSPEIISKIDNLLKR